MKKLLDSLFIFDDTAYLCSDGENIVICSDNDNGEGLCVSLNDIDEIFCFGCRGCSSELIKKCAEFYIPVHFIFNEEKMIANLSCVTRGSAYIRKKQHELLSRPNPLLMQNTVAVRLSNAKYILLRTLKRNPLINKSGSISKCIAFIEEGVRTVYEVSDREIIAGIERNAERAYYSVFDSPVIDCTDGLCNSRLSFDRVNSMLEFLGVIIELSCVCALESAGLDSHAGFYHAVRSGRHALANDIAEEMTVFAEELVIAMINTKVISPADFEIQPGGAVFIKEAGKRKITAKWNSKRREKVLHPYLGKRVPIGLIPYIQSNLLSKYFRGEIPEYPCFIRV